MMGCTCGHDPMIPSGAHRGTCNYEHEPDELNPRGLTEDELEKWEEEHQQFATVERADAAADAWDQEHLTPEVLAESEREVARIEEDYDDDERGRRWSEVRTEGPRPNAIDREYLAERAEAARQDELAEVTAKSREYLDALLECGRGTIPPAKPFPPAPGTTAAEVRRWTLEDAIAFAEEVEDETTRLALTRFGRWADALEAELAKLELRTRIE